MSNTELEQLIESFLANVNTLGSEKKEYYRASQNSPLTDTLSFRRYMSHELAQLISIHYISKSKVLEAIEEGRFIDPSITSGENINQFRVDLRTKLGLERTE